MARGLDADLPSLRRWLPAGAAPPAWARPPCAVRAEAIAATASSPSAHLAASMHDAVRVDPFGADALQRLRQIIEAA